jgi:hypothetical protein
MRAMMRAVGVLFAMLVAVSTTAKAGNSDDVVAGADVALTGGAVVANVHTGGAMWFNPAGVARLDSRSVDLTGAVLSYNIVRAPGVLSIEGGEQSNGDFSSTQAIPRALTFVAAPRPALPSSGRTRLPRQRAPRNRPNSMRPRTRPRTSTMQAPPWLGSIATSSSWAAG